MTDDPFAIPRTSRPQRVCGNPKCRKTLSSLNKELYCFSCYDRGYMGQAKRQNRLARCSVEARPFVPSSVGVHASEPGTEGISEQALHTSKLLEAMRNRRDRMMNAAGNQDAVSFESAGEPL